MKKIFIVLSLLLLFFVANATEIASETLLETTTSWDGNPLPNYPTSQPKITILKITIPPKSTLSEHYHSIINCAVVTKGSLKVVKDNGEEKVIKAGEAIAEVVGPFHYGANEGLIPVELIVFYAGDAKAPLSIKK